MGNAMATQNSLAPCCSPLPPPHGRCQDQHTAVVGGKERTYGTNGGTNGYLLDHPPQQSRSDHTNVAEPSFHMHMHMA